MDQSDLEFDEAGLKGAVRRAWGAEQAPQRLRGRISHLMATAGSMDEASATPRVTSWDRWLSRAYGLAAAAVLILGIALLALYYQGALEPRVARADSPAMVVHLTPTRTNVPLPLAQSLVATHTACGQLTDHHLIDRAAARTYGELTLKLTADLGFPSVARSIGGDWKFRGAGECPVGELRAAHLMFARGAETVSVFSLPSHCMGSAAAGAQYQGLVNGHPIAGFARPGAAYAVVGSGLTASLSVDDVASIRDSLFGIFDVSGCGETGTGGLDELD